MGKKLTSEDHDLLEELGVEDDPSSNGSASHREQRIIAGFQEIERFVEENGRLPKQGEGKDIFERIYAVRLEQIQKSAECLEVLNGRDPLGILGSFQEVSKLKETPLETDEDLLAALGVANPPGGEMTQLVFVRSQEEIREAEEIANKTPCPDFKIFKPLFDEIRKDLKSGDRRTVRYKDNAEVSKGDIFILDGQTVIVAEKPELFKADHGRYDGRLRVIYDNGTESNILYRSLQRALNKDKSSRRVLVNEEGPLFSHIEEEGDLESGHIYVLRSKSDHPFIAEHRDVIHKIGVTGGDIKARIAGARKDPTYLLADVEVVASFKLANINRKKMEALLHRFFAPARLDLELKDRFGFDVLPQEWFLVPLPVIEEVVEKIKSGNVGNNRYDPKTATLVVD